jgi:cation diffusion facilitator CzcD-associated flavoprotein CzcO
VVGTGASAVQFVPEIVQDAARVHVFQRTPPWIVPKLDHAIPPARQRLYARFPTLRRLLRWTLFWLHEFRVLGFVRISPLTRAVQKMALAHLARQVPDPALRARLTPDYTIGCKRVLISNDWYPAIGRDNVELLAQPPREVREHAIVAADGTEREVDAIVFGTGFEVTEGFQRIRVTGRGGVTLADAWRDGLRAHQGIAMAGFPNWFMLLGPNTGLGHNSVVLMIEGQVRYVVDALRRMRQRGARAIDVRPQALERSMREIDARMARTVWQSGGCRSWYQDARGRNTTLWPGSVPSYLWRTRRADLGDYALWR